MNLRWDESCERVSALVLLTISLLLTEWFRGRVAAVEATLSRREVQLEHLAAWSRAATPLDAREPNHLRGLFGADEEVVLGSSSVGRHLMLRPLVEVGR